MKSRFFKGFVITLLLVCFAGMANGAIVNINAVSNTTTNPVVLHLDAGTYEVVPIGVADGGAYNSWNAWGYVGLPDRGWINNYSLSSDEFEAYTISDGGRYATDLIALENAQSTSFTLTSAGDVSFFITDRPYSDNLGGMSLDVNAVPVPGAVLCLFSGLIVLVATRRREISR